MDETSPPLHHDVFRGFTAGAAAGTTLFGVVSLLQLVDYKLEENLDLLACTGLASSITGAGMGAAFQCATRLRHLARSSLVVVASAAAAPAFLYVYTWVTGLFLHSRRVAWHWFTELTWSLRDPSWLPDVCTPVFPWLVVVGLAYSYGLKIGVQCGLAVLAGLGTFVLCLATLGRVSPDLAPLLVVGPPVVPLALLAGTAVYDWGRRRVETAASA